MKQEVVVFIHVDNDHNIFTEVKEEDRCIRSNCYTHCLEEKLEKIRPNILVFIHFDI